MQHSLLIGCLLAALSLADESPPLIIEHPLDVIVSKGAPATLNCAARPSTSNITWYKDGQKVITNKEDVNSKRIVIGDGSLFLLSVTSNKNGKDADAGTYYCVAKNENGEAKSREAVLRIAMLREEFRQRPNNIQALNGEKAVLTCSPPRGFPEPVVTWRKDDRELKIQDISRYTLHPEGNLIIDPVDHSDSGSYVCVATNMVGERASAAGKLSVYEKPVFLMKPKDITVEAGNSVLFDCKVSGEPQPLISWRRVNALMPQDRTHIAGDNRGLKIERVQVEDEGEYTCHARNPVGTIEHTAKLRVMAPPSFSVRPIDQTVQKGSKVSFDCVAAGQPLPTMYWGREASTDMFFPDYISPDGRVQVSQNGQLSVNDVRPSDAGGYVCAAMNSAGSAITTARLALIGGKAPEARAPPVITHGPANQTILVDTTAILPCGAISGREDTLTPKIEWLFNGVRIDPASNTRMSQHSGGSLHIADLKLTDSGVYTCRGKNEDGESTWTASLTVEEHTNHRALFFRMPDAIEFPSAPGKPIASNLSHDALDLTWTAPEKNGAAPVSGYMIQYYSPEEAQTWYNLNDYVSGTKYRVKNLKPGQTYLFVVRAENDKGIGGPSKPSDPVTTSNAPAHVSHEEPDGDEGERKKLLQSDPLVKLEEVKTINSTAVRLFWKKKMGRVEPGLITGYHVKWKGPTPGDSQLLTVSGEHTDSVVVNDLLPFTSYEFFVIPFNDDIKGAPSNTLEALTAEAPPSQPPQNVMIRMLNLTTLRISWKPPRMEGLNGVLKGFQIVIIGTGTKFNRNITTNERAASVTLFHLITGMSYRIRVAARTSAGIGVSHGTDVVEMTQATYERHLAMYSDEPWLSMLIQKSWFQLAVFILIWILVMASCVVFFIKRKQQRVDGTGRLTPFIKINDGSVHMAPPHWSVESAYHTTARCLPTGTLGHARMNGTAQQLYSTTPTQHEFYNVYHTNDIIGTLNRPGSEPQYHYAQVTGGTPNMSTFYGNHYQDDPSPYATTTLVTTGQQPSWLNDRMLRGPALPSNPIPSAPPPRFASSGAMDTGRRSRSSRGSEYKATGVGSNSDSPPHTDVSYVQSSDGTGGSSNGRGKVGTLGDRRSPPKHNLADFIPPPPPSNPPPMNREDFYGDFEPNGRRPTSRNRNAGRQRTHRDDDSQRSSLMDEEKRRGHTGDSSEADGENSDGDVPRSRGGTRPPQPVMGVSASTLSQSSYDNRASASRFKSMQRPVRADQQ